MLLVPIKLCSDQVFFHAKNEIVLIKSIIVDPVGSESHITKGRESATRQ